MEQQRDQQERRVMLQETEALATAASVTPAAPTTTAEVPPAPAAADELLPPVTDTQGLVRELAERIGEESGQIVVLRDLSTLLERMEDGVVVQLSVSRPRFFKKLSLEDLGLKVNQDLATSEEALRIISNYFQLGRRSLLPRTWQDRLANVENSARYCLKRHSLKSHWGAFIPLQEYERWKNENAEHKAVFWKLRDEILANYDALCEEVLADFRLLAEDSWRRVLLSSSIKEPAIVERAVITQLLQRLHAEEGKDAFLEAYMTTIRHALPSRVEIEESFAYHEEIGVIPLPSLLAQDIQQADSIYQERALRDARVRAELDALERQRQEEMRKLSAQEQEEREQRYLRLRAEQERLRLQQEMEHDVLANARAEKERLVREFYSEVVVQINELIRDVTSNVLESLDEHQGIIRGPVSSQLRNLVGQLERLNFMNDAQLLQQIQRIQSIIPSQAERDQARKGLARIDTSQMQRVVRQVHDAANEVLIGLETATGQRKTRTGETPLEGGHLIELGARKTRPAAASFNKPSIRGVKPRRTHHEE
jgi:translation initiation factor 2 beta subunit (eIF-2beta)/eIF-5